MPTPRLTDAGARLSDMLAEGARSPHCAAFGMPNAARVPPGRA